VPVAEVAYLARDSPKRRRDAKPAYEVEWIADIDPVDRMSHHEAWRIATSLGFDMILPHYED
jgi:hypothetical protein